jgi:hypothetical protein
MNNNDDDDDDDNDNNDNSGSDNDGDSGFGGDSRNDNDRSGSGDNSQDFCSALNGGDLWYLELLAHALGYGSVDGAARTFCGVTSFGQ